MYHTFSTGLCNNNICNQQVKKHVMRFSPSCENQRRSGHAIRQTADADFPKCRRRPSARWFIRFSIILGIFFISTTFLASKGQAAFQADDLNGASQYSSGRSLLSAEGGPNGSKEHQLPVYERCDFEEDHYPYAWVVLYAIIVLWFFIALAIICDDFFVPSLEVISEELDLSEDVAGATFMAAGSSAPELFTSIAGVAFQSDVGVGTIVGSAVFNINIIIALTAALAGQVLVLDPRPLIRDSLFYALSIACFIGFAWDGMFEIWEAIIMLVLYAVYIILMKFNTQIMNMTCCKPTDVGPVPLDEEASVDGDEGSHPVVAKKVGESSSTLGSFSNVGPPQKLPPISSQTGPSMLTRKESLGVPGASGDPHQKHVFHHVKHGELSHHFTHSQVDLRRDLDNCSETGSVRPPTGGRKSRPASAASNRSKMGNNNLANGHTNVAVVGNGNVPNSNHSIQSGEVQRNGVLHKNSSIKTCKDVELGDLESLGGDSYGSQTRLHPPNNNSDFDSGIHSALGPTPVQSFHPSSTDPSNSSASKKHGTDGDQDGKHVDEDKDEEDEPTLRPCWCMPAINMYYPENDIMGETCGCFRLFLKWLLFIISYPFVCMFTWTIPNCGNPKYRKYYVASFGLSVLWIAALSFAMVTLVIRAGCLLKVDHYVMGLVIVAIGTSVPDALSSILVARDGYGDMAVSNALGSNVFDIDLGLGLPYAISIAIRGGAPMMLLNEAEMAMLESGEMVITPHAKFGFILLLILIFTLIIFCAVRFRLNKVVGVTFVSMYVLFIVYAFIQEFVCNYDC
ncbi:sodium/potassium/calcium exchanger 4-like isoform X2 [Amphiura filiformis]|uniref:sodium/potassium/calcium exchanger 4-like isoform X2 n=1 Tax=Amphiura filiformis TaxID=82378 RepID=UPI003B21B2B3